MFNRELIETLYKKAGLFEPRWLGVIIHQAGVMSIAGLLAFKLNEKQELKIDVNLTETGALLHDIGRAFDESPQGHVLSGVEFLIEQKVDKRIIQIVRKHSFWLFGDEIPIPSTWEEKLVFFGDLTFSSHIMSMEERIKDLSLRYDVCRLVEEAQKLYQEISELLLPEQLFV